MVTTDEFTNEINERAEALFHEQQEHAYKRTDKLFAVLMVIQWIGAIITALWISPRAWAGVYSETHIHVWAALLLGGLITSLPVYFALFRPGRTYTRHLIAIGQLLMSALLIHLTGGRIETHFHVFGSLAFLAFYRDWRVLITASVVVAIDHGLRGIFWPQSVYGVLTIEPWRWVEHVFWVVFEDIFLIISIQQSIREMWTVARRQAELESTRALIEAKVKERTAQLQEEVKQREALTKQLEDQKGELAHSNEELQRFAYVAAHDLKEPLRTIVSFTNLMAEDLKGKLDESSFENMGFIVEAGKRMQLLVSDLLKYSRVETQSKEFTETPCNAVVEQAVSGLKSIIEEAKGKVICDPLPTVKADPIQIAQVFSNLVANSVKFRGQEPPQIHVSAKRNDDKWVFSVRDNGIGIDMKFADRIFHMFQRLHNAAEYPGTGIGLAVCKKIIERHGGKIWIESAPGEGTEFFFTLPVEQPTTAEQSPPVEHSPPASNQKERLSSPSLW
jgi:signal transduction histidine kinase